jgi:DNA-binding LacI/PurR family transcriptional regulator
MGAERSGARIPDDLMVIAHCNFPWPDAPTVPVRRLGFDAHEVLRTSLDLLDAEARGEHPPRLTEIPVRAERELERAG